MSCSFFTLLKLFRSPIPPFTQPQPEKSEDTSASFASVSPGCSPSSPEGSPLSKKHVISVETQRLYDEIEKSIDLGQLEEAESLANQMPDDMLKIKAFRKLAGEYFYKNEFSKERELLKQAANVAKNMSEGTILDAKKKSRVLKELSRRYFNSIIKNIDMVQSLEEEILEKKKLEENILEVKRMLEEAKKVANGISDVRQKSVSLNEVACEYCEIACLCFETAYELNQIAKQANQAIVRAHNDPEIVSQCNEIVKKTQTVKDLLQSYGNDSLNEADTIANQIYDEIRTSSDSCEKATTLREIVNIYLYMIKNRLNRKNENLNRENLLQKAQRAADAMPENTKNAAFRKIYAFIEIARVHIKINSSTTAMKILQQAEKIAKEKLDDVLKEKSYVLQDIALTYHESNDYSLIEEATRLEQSIKPVDRDSDSDEEGIIPSWNF